jgi:hypothetical protein
MSLYRYHRRHGTAVEARRTLSDVYKSFTEGFNTTDLLDAKAVLADNPGSSSDPGV